MSLEERTLVVRNIDGDRLTADLLEELFANFGPVVKVVLRKSFAFIEFTVKVSVGYAWAMTDGLCLQGRELRVAPKLDSDPSYYAFRDALQAFQRRIDQDPAFLEGLLSGEQRQERQALVDGLDAGSPEVLGRLQRRLRQCEQHAVPKSTYNAVIRRDLARLTRGGGSGGGKQQRDDEGFNDPARYLNGGHSVYREVTYDSPSHLHPPHHHHHQQQQQQHYQQHRRSQSLDGRWSSGGGNNHHQQHYYPDSEYQFDYPQFRPPPPPPQSLQRGNGGGYHHYHQQQQYHPNQYMNYGGSQPNLSHNHQHYQQPPPPPPPPPPHPWSHHQAPPHPPPPHQQPHHQHYAPADRPSAPAAAAAAADPYSSPYFEPPQRPPPPSTSFTPVVPPPGSRPPPPGHHHQHTQGPSYHLPPPPPQSAYSAEFEPRAPAPSANPRHSGGSGGGSYRHRPY